MNSLQRFLPSRHTLVVSGAVMALTSILAIVTPMQRSDAALAFSVPPAAGQLLASNCYQCHGTNGTSGGFDTLAGDSYADTYDHLMQMKNSASTSSIMVAHAKGYTPAEIDALARYFASLPKP